MAITKSLLNTPADHSPNTQLTIDGFQVPGHAGELLIDLLNSRTAVHAQKAGAAGLLCAADGADSKLRYLHGEGQRLRLVRACATRVAAGMKVETTGETVDIAQREAFDRILQNHMLYCTVCDNNNGNCTIHNTTKELDVKHQSRPFTPKPYEKDMSNPFYRYDPDQCILCGRCVESCQNVQVNETLSIDWESDHPRVLWDGGEKIEGSSCVSCGHCVTVCPCNALMEKSMLGQAGYLTDTPDGRAGQDDRCGQGDRAADRLWADSCALRDGSGDAQPSARRRPRRSVPTARSDAASMCGRATGTS